jgi:geranylgeranyl diphosphate synthase type II
MEREEVDSPACNVEQLEQVHARKTGALIRASLQLGVLAAHSACPDVAPELLERFDTYGKSIGLAFQIVDDLLDVEGTAQQTGKRVRKDEARGKLTYPRLLGVEASRRQAAELGRQARKALAFLGPHAHTLDKLVQYILDRDR